MVKTGDATRILRFVGHMNYIYRTDVSPELYPVFDALVKEKKLQPSSKDEDMYVLGPRASMSYRKLRG